MEKTRRHAFRLPLELSSELESFADANGVSMTSVVIEAIGAYIHRGTQSGTQPDTQKGGDGTHDGSLVTALIEQLRSKDEQIANRDQQINGLMTLIAMRDAEQRKRLPWTKRVKAFFVGDVES